MGRLFSKLLELAARAYAKVTGRRVWDDEGPYA